MVFRSIHPLIEKAEEIFISNMMPIATEDDSNNPSETKVGVDRAFNAIYMSRSAIPSTDHEEVPANSYKQVCVRPFRCDFMKKFNYQLYNTSLDQQESIEMLRAIEHGYKVSIGLYAFQTKSVDNQQDLEEATIIIKQDVVKENYSNK